LGIRRGPKKKMTRKQEWEGGVKREFGYHGRSKKKPALVKCWNTRKSYTHESEVKKGRDTYLGKILGGKQLGELSEAE